MSALILIATMLSFGTTSVRQDVEFQPLAAQAVRVLETLDYLGAPLPMVEKKAVLDATRGADAARGVATIQRVLDKHCLLLVEINPESRVKVGPGPAKAELQEQGWRTFLVKVTNDAGVTAPLAIASPNAEPVYARTDDRKAALRFRQDGNDPRAVARNRWLSIEQYTKNPLKPQLSGLNVEYRVLSLYSRDQGQREAKISANVGQGTQDIGFRSEADILFTIQPSVDVKLHVLDESGKPATAAFQFRDPLGRVYPSQAKRLAPDFFFHPQIYRANGESVKLPAGTYNVEVTRGPEYLPILRTITVPKGKTASESFRLARWIDPSLTGWYSGDHHIHAAGCAHYEMPTEGVLASDMMRHCLGEDLKIGCNLTWGPCFDYQKQFFTGKDDPVSQFPYLLHYDVEVSGFGSHQSGHLCLLRLKEEIYPGGDSKNHWPKLCLNTYKWAKAQGAVCGPAHSGWGLEQPNADLPSYNVPAFNGIGANEYVVDVTHKVLGPGGELVPAVDFLSMVDTPYAYELNVWYHTLNCGYRTRVSGETDFPCIYGERVGLGRSYVKIDGKLDYNTWCENIRKGRNYVSDGYSHLMNFTVGGVKMGENGSELKLAEPGTVKVTARVAAHLDEKLHPEIKNLPYQQKPYWNIERSRVGETREVPVELIVNGYSVAKQIIVADGKEQELTFEAKIERSSWVALRILPSSHTNPVFVVVGEKPIRASRRSAEWCIKAVENCYREKKRFMDTEKEQKDFEEAYAHARQEYRRILSECEVD